MLDSFRMDVDKRLDIMAGKMSMKQMLIVSVIVPLIGINVAF